MKSSADYLSMREACAYVGIKPSRCAQRRLLRRVMAKEQSGNVEILVRLTGPSRTHYRITGATLREHCPELFSKTDVVFQAMQNMATSTNDRLDAIQSRLASLESQFSDHTRTHTRGA